MVPVLGISLLLFWWPGRAKYTPFEWRWLIPLIGLLLAIADVAYFKAIACSGTLISLLTAVRSASAIVSFLAGAVLFGEVRIMQKSFALAGVLIGVFLLFLSH
jgi:transporter family protein